MRSFFRTWPGLAILILALAAGTALAADKDKKDDAPDKGDPPRLAPYLGQLRGLFKLWDGNGDDALDAAELARAFRGPKAVPLDPKPGSGETGKVRTDLPDVMFLSQLDKDSNSQLSRDEFETWAMDYAKQLHEAAEAQERIISLQKKMIKATRNEMEQLEKQLQRERSAMDKLADRMRAYEKHLRQQQFPPRK